MKILTNNKTFKNFLENLCIFFLIIFFEIFFSIPIHFFNDISILPNVASILIFYFLIVSQDKVNYFLIFILGFLFDIFNLLLLGSTAFVWLISAGIIIFLRKHLYTPDSFIISLRDFSLYTFINNILEWVLFSTIYRHLYPFSNFLIQTLVNIIFFAILYKLLKKIEEGLR